MDNRDYELILIIFDADGSNFFLHFLIEILKNPFFGVCYTYSAAAATFPRELSSKADILAGSLEHFQMADVRGYFLSDDLLGLSSFFLSTWRNTGH